MTGPSPVDRRLYGDMADDIHLLRTDGRIVARFKAGFRIDSSPEIYTPAQVRGMAAQLRARRQATASRRPPDRPRARLVNHSISTSARSENETAGEGAGTTDQAGGPGSALATNPFDEPRSPAFSASDSGVDCSAQNPRQVTEPVVPAGNEGRAGERGTSSLQKVQTTPGGVSMCPCGRPIPHGGRCWHKRGWPGPPIKRVRQTRKERRPMGITARIVALECEVDALKSAVERMQKAQSDIRGQLGIGETR